MNRSVFSLKSERLLQKTEQRNGTPRARKEIGTSFRSVFRSVPTLVQFRSEFKDGPMTHKHGTHLTGIRSLADLRSRCYIDPDTECWHCRTTLRFGVPNFRLRMPDGTMPVVSGRRGVMLLLTSFRMPASHVAFARPGCTAIDCVNPDHTTSGTRKALGDAMRRRGSTAPKPDRLVAITRNARARASTKLSIDKAREIRASDKTSDELSEQYGVPASNIRAIRRGVAWKETALPAASVFSFAGSL